jgi:hypothetical protein
MDQKAITLPTQFSTAKNMKHKQRRERERKRVKKNVYVKHLNTFFLIDRVIIEVGEEGTCNEEGDIKSKALSQVMTFVKESEYPNMGEWRTRREDTQNGEKRKAR